MRHGGQPLSVVQAPLKAPGTRVASGLIHALLVQRAVRRPLVRNRTCPRRRRTPPTCRSNPIPMNCSTPIHRRLRTIPTHPMVRIQQRRWYLRIRTTGHRVFDFAVPDQQKNARLCLAGGHFFSWPFLAFFPGADDAQIKGSLSGFRPMRALVQSTLPAVPCARLQRRTFPALRPRP